MPPSPIRFRPAPNFRILLNGEPWQFDRQVFAVLHYEKRQDGWGINNSLTPHYNHPQKLEFDRDRVVQVADSMIASRLSVRPRTGDARPEERATLTQPWFSVPVKLPITFDDTNEVRATTCPLPVAISYSRPLDTAQGSTVELELTWLDEPGASRLRPSHFREPMSEDYTFAALQPGRYQLAIAAPGAARYESPAIDVRAGMAPLAIRLTGASDIQAKIVLPGFAKEDELPHAMRCALHPHLWRDFIPIATLYRDAAEVASSTLDTKTSRVTFSNIAPGTYRLRVHGVSDFLEKASVPLAVERAGNDPAERTRLRAMTLNNRTRSGEAANVAWEDAEIAIRVESDSPIVIDGGQIQLRRVALPKR